MSADGEKKQLELELLAADLRLRRKQEFWETPRNIAILVGVTAAIAAAIGFWFGRESGPPAPTARPVTFRDFVDMHNGELIDAIQTIVLVVIAGVLIYVVTRLDKAVTIAAKRLKSMIAKQQGIEGTIDRLWQRTEAVESSMLERNAILPTPTLKSVLRDLTQRLDALEAKDESPPDNH